MPRKADENLVIFRFADFELDEAAGELRQRGIAIGLQPKPFELLRLLIRERDRIVPIRELLQRLWPDAIVTPSSLTRAVSHARRGLGDTHRGELVRSFARRGYRFCAPVEVIDPAARSGDTRSSSDSQSGQTQPASHSDDVAALEVRDSAALSQAVMSQSWSRDGATPASRTHAAAPFVGRESARATLRACLTRVGAGRSAIAIVRGPAGIGKSRLTEVFLDEVRASAWRVLIGRCRDGQGVPAYWPWVQILRQLLEDPELRDETELLAGSAQEIAGLIPELEIDPTRSAALEAARTANGAADTDPSQFLFYDAVSRVLASCARRSGLILVLEDLQWAGAGALRLLEHLVCEASNAPLLLLTTVRDETFERGHPLIRTLSILKQQDACEEIALRGFSRREVAQLLELVIGRAPPTDLTSELYARTEGTPLFVREAIRLLSERGALERLDQLSLHGVHLPQRALDLIRRGLDVLSEPAAELIGAAAVLGREFSLPALAEIAQCSRERALELLDEAARAGIVTPDPQRPAWHRFSHALYEEAAYRGLSASTQTLLHHRAACRLERLHAGDLEQVVCELAHHHHRALAVGDPARAAEIALRAAEHARRLFAHEQAAAHYEQALVAIEHCEPVDPVRRLQTQLALGEILGAGGERTRRRSVLSEAMQAAALHERPLDLARAAIAFCDLSEWSPSDPTAYAALERALQQLPPEAQSMRVRLLTRLAYLSARESRTRAEPMARRAVAGARELDDAQTLVDALYTLHFVISGPDDLKERATLISEIAALASRCSRRDPAVIALMDVASDRIALGDAEGARELRAAAERACGRDRHPGLVWHMRVYDTGWLMLIGDFETAERTAHEAHRIGQRVEHPYADACHAAHLAGLALERGDPEHAIERIERYAGAPGRPVHWIQALLGRAYARLGRIEHANQIMQRLAANQLEDVPRNIRWTSSMVEIAGLAADVEDAACARLLLEPLRGVRDHHAVLPIPICYGGPVTRALARLETLLGATDVALSLFQAALESCRRLGARPMLAHTLVEYAALRAATGCFGASVPMLDEALGIARELGMQPLVREAEALRSRASV